MLSFEVKLAIKGDYANRIKTGKKLNEESKSNVIDYTNPDYIKEKLIRDIYSYDVNDMDFVEEMYEIVGTNTTAYETIKFILDL